MAKHHEMIIYYPHQKRGALRFLRRNIINKQRWNSPTGTRDADAKRQGQGHRRGIWCVAFSPIDQVVASASGPGSSMSLPLPLCHGSDLHRI